MVTAQCWWYLFSLCCSKQPLSTTKQRLERHCISLATNPPAFAPNSEFCTSFNTRDYTIKIIVVNWRASEYFQGYILCLSELSLHQPHPPGHFYLGISESYRVLWWVLALTGFGPWWQVAQGAAACCKGATWASFLQPSPKSNKSINI